MAMNGSRSRWEVALQVLLICLFLTVATSAVMPPSLTIRGYAHLRLGVPDATEQTVVPGVNGTGTGVVFGTGIVVADPFRQGTNGTSDLVGTIRGFGIYDDLAGTNKYLSLSITFLIEYQNVSGTVVVVGTRVSTDATRTLTVVGGTGDFALARGIATQTPVFTGPANDSTAAIVSVNEWRLTMVCEPVGPDLAYLALKLPNLVPLNSYAGNPF